MKVPRSESGKILLGMRFDIIFLKLFSSRQIMLKLQIDSRLVDLRGNLERHDINLCKERYFSYIFSFTAYHKMPWHWQSFSHPGCNHYEHDKLYKPCRDGDQQKELNTTVLCAFNLNLPLKEKHCSNGCHQYDLECNDILHLSIKRIVSQPANVSTFYFCHPFCVCFYFSFK